MHSLDANEAPFFRSINAKPTQKKILLYASCIRLNVRRRRNFSANPRDEWILWIFAQRATYPFASPRFEARGESSIFDSPTRGSNGSKCDARKHKASDATNWTCYSARTQQLRTFTRVITCSRTLLGTLIYILYYSAVVRRKSCLATIHRPPALFARPFTNQSPTLA